MHRLMVPVLPAVILGVLLSCASAPPPPASGTAPETERATPADTLQEAQYDKMFMQVHASALTFHDAPIHMSVVVAG